MTIDTVVVGAGPAGLATSYELARRGVSHVVLERGEAVGHTWRHLYDSLVLHTGKHLSTLPGLRFSASTPLFPTRAQVVDYLTAYADRFSLPVHTRANVSEILCDNGRWTTRTAGGDVFQSRAVVIATGIAANPWTPEIPGRAAYAGRVRHSIDYRRPSDIPGPRVLVVGAGNSAAEIAAELAATARHDVTLAARSGNFVVPLTMLGVPAQYISLGFGFLPHAVQRAIIATASRVGARLRPQGVLPTPPAGPCPRVPLIGFHLTDAIRHGSVRVQRGLDSFTATGMRFADGAESAFDDVVFATGFRAALEPLRRHVTLDRCGYASRRDRVVSTDCPNLFFVGHNPDPRGALFAMRRDARDVGRRVAAGAGRA